MLEQHSPSNHFIQNQWFTLLPKIGICDISEIVINRPGYTIVVMKAIMLMG